MGSKWRRWATPITLLLLLGLLGYGAWWGWEQLTRPAVETPPPACVTQSASVLTAAQVTVRVFNGGTTAGRASQITEQLKAKGFVTKSPTNTNEPVEVTTIVGGTADSPAVLLVMGFFPESQARADGRTDGTVDVLVGDSFAGFNDAAPTEMAVPGGTVCLPGTSPSADQSATPSATPTA